MADEIKLDQPTAQRIGAATVYVEKLSRNQQTPSRAARQPTINGGFIVRCETDVAAGQFGQFRFCVGPKGQEQPTGEPLRMYVRWGDYTAGNDALAEMVNGELEINQTPCPNES